jgi:monoamine oxidase
LARSPLRPQVLVIGAGAAGLAAAAALARAGRSVLVVEARDRIGGRCETRRLPGVPAPVELGAEFIHGQPKATLSLLEETNTPAVDSTRIQLMLDRGRLRTVNAFDEARRAVRRKPRGADISFAQFLKKQRLPRLTRTLATMMVQGFDAADPAEASARDIAEEWGAAAIGASQPRPQGGYGRLMEFLSRDLELRLDSAVREVRWARGAVEVHGDDWSARAPQALITLPLGVLHAGSVRFTPRLDKDLGRLASGPVIRVAMAFDQPFWEQTHPGVAFFHNPEAAFPTFWTPLPMHAPLITAWAGGPKAARLTGLPEERLLAEALACVRRVLKTRKRPGAFLVHDWQADPYARGGYSYVRVGGQGAREALGKPLEETLFFAGEATAVEDSGTVGGALASGIRAAREILNSGTEP